MFKLFRPIGHLIGCGILAGLTALGVLLAKFVPKLWFSFYTDFSRGAMRFLGGVFGWIPFPVWELLLVLLVLSIPVGLIYAIKKRKVLGWLTALLELVCLLAFLFVGLWGLNHYAPSMGEQIGLEVHTYTKTELTAAARYYAGQASAWSVRVERDEAGNLIVPDTAALSELASESYDRLGEENDRFRDPVRRVKPLLLSKAFAYTGTTGIFICFTGEPCVSTADFALNHPYTICHEMGHSLAFAGEDEANYCAFLACRASDSPILQYSGYYNAFLYCYNALHRVDAKAAEQLWSLCSPEMIRDCNRDAEESKQYEGPAKEATQKANDGYLKAFEQEGVQSYGMVTDYLIADYLANNPPAD